MLCYLRWLDRDCDGFISEKDFSSMCNAAAEIDGASALLRKWRAAGSRWTTPASKGAREACSISLAGYGIHRKVKVEVGRDETSVV